MNKLNNEEIEFITKCLKEGKPLPDNYRYIIPFETKKEYELTYDGKEREEDILADTMAVPLQPVKTFGNPERDQRSYGAGGNGGWTNKLIFGDNLQVLKALMDDPEVYDKNTGRGKVRLIYIDPPFATRQEFRGSRDQKAYQDKIAGSEFMEFLRKRLIFLREILADDGTIYIHLDYRTLHYIKLLMDEIFGKEKLINEVVYSYRIQGISRSSWARKHQTLLFYAKTPNYLFKPEKEIVYYEKPFIGTKKDEKGRYYNDVFVRDVWDCDYTKPFISGSKEYVGYRTQKSEGLLKRIIEASTEEGDLVLDAFAGSGTTGAVAEKLGRRWIMIDCGKLAIYTM